MRERLGTLPSWFFFLIRKPMMPYVGRRSDDYWRRNFLFLCSTIRNYKVSLRLVHWLISSLVGIQKRVVPQFRIVIIVLRDNRKNKQTKIPTGRWIFTHTQTLCKLFVVELLFSTLKRGVVRPLHKPVTTVPTPKSEVIPVMAMVYHNR